MTKTIPGLTLDRILHLIYYNWEICSEVEEIIAKLVFWGDWKPSLLECPRLNFGNGCFTKINWCALQRGAELSKLRVRHRGYPPITAVCLDKISIYCENLTKHDILETQKYYLIRVFKTRFS
jgi:hypothetical protein